jgi:hypothetical protein
MIRYSFEIQKVVEMIVHLNDGIIAAMPDDPVSGGYNKQEVFTAAAAPSQASLTSLRREVDPLTATTMRVMFPSAGVAATGLSTVAATGLSTYSRSTFAA